MVTLELDSERAAVLLRCLDYGENAISLDEEKTGVAKLLREDIQMIRNSVATQLINSIIGKAADDEYKENYKGETR